MTWMLIRLVFSLAFVGGVLWFAARIAKKRGLGGSANGLIEVVARQRMGRSSSVNVVRIGDVVLVVGATEEQLTLLAEVDSDTIDTALRGAGDGRGIPVTAQADDDEQDDDGYRPGGGLHRPPAAARVPTSGALAGSVFDTNGWGSFVNHMRERTVRRP